MQTVVLSVGGSMINPGEIDLAYVKKFAELLKEKNGKMRIAVVVGGGKNARIYAQAVRDLGGNEFYADSAGVLSTRQNAMLLIAALGDYSYHQVITDFERVPETEKILVMGGTIPGITTDGDSALLAELLKADRLVNLSNVDGIYDKDPRKHKDAKKYELLSHNELLSIAAQQDERKAGQNFIFDIYACKIIARSNIESHFVNGKDLDAVEKAIEGKKHNGTVIKS